MSYVRTNLPSSGETYLQGKFSPWRITKTRWQRKDRPIEAFREAQWHWKLRIINLSRFEVPHSNVYIWYLDSLANEIYPTSQLLVKSFFLCKRTIGRVEKFKSFGSNRVILASEKSNRWSLSYTVRTWLASHGSNPDDNFVQSNYGVELSPLGRDSLCLPSLEERFLISARVASLVLPNALIKK